MGLMDFFNAKGQGGAEEGLDDLIRKAANDPAYRPKFYKEFLEYDLYVVGEVTGDFKKVGDDGSMVAGNDTKILLAVFDINGKKQVPVFSSLARLQSAIKNEVKFTKANGRTILEGLPKGVPVILNPGAAYGKEFAPDEIRQMLDGSIFSVPESRVMKGQQKILLFEPADYPTKLVNALISYFEETKCVDKAYLAQIHLPEGSDPPHCIIGLEMPKTSGMPLEGVLSEIGIISKDTLPQGQFVDFTDMGQKGTITDYLINETKPFYVR